MEQKQNRFTIACAYDVRWQLLRIDLKGDFGYYDGIQNNLKRIDVYLGELKEPRDYAVGLLRVVNLLDAILLGNRGKDYFEECDALITQYRDNCKRVMLSFQPELTNAEEAGWDWGRVAQDLGAFSRNDKRLWRVKKDLDRRLLTSTKKYGASLNRNELKMFMSLLEKYLVKN